MQETDAQVVSMDRHIADLALDAHRRFGKGRHKAALNMGDCFSYACAKAHRVPLLCKGDDFIHTDIRIA
jgi:ribonuclease VapC